MTGYESETVMFCWSLILNNDIPLRGYSESIEQIKQWILEDLRIRGYVAVTDYCTSTHVAGPHMFNLSLWVFGEKIDGT